MKKRIYLAELLLVFVLVIFGLTRKEEPVLSLSDVSLQEVYTTTNFGVKPGIYKVRVEAAVPKDSELIITVQSAEENNHRAFMSNVVRLYGGQETLEYEFYVTEKLELLSLTSTPIDVPEKAEVQGKITVLQTGKGWSALAIVFLLVMTVVHGISYFRNLIKEKRITKEQQVTIWVLAGTVLLSCIPCAADCLLHTGNEAGFQSGGLFMLPAVFLRICGLSVITVYHITVFAVGTATAVICYFCFKRCVEDCYAALLGTVFYTLNPYRLYSLYSVGDMAEYLAMTFLPLVFCGTYLLLKQETEEKQYGKCKYYLAAGFTGLLHTSPALGLISFFVFLVFGMCNRKRSVRKETLKQVAGGLGLAIGCNLWFLIPFVQLLGQKDIWSAYLESFLSSSVGSSLEDLFRLLPKALVSQSGRGVGTQGQLGIATVSVLLLYAAYWVKNRKAKDCSSRESNVLFWTILVCILMSTRYFPWSLLEKVPVLGKMVIFMQSPVKMMAIVGALCAFLICFFMKREAEKAYRKYEMVFLGIVIAGVTVFYLNDAVYFMNPAYIYSLPNPGYVPVGVDGVWLWDASGFIPATGISVVCVLLWISMTVLGRRKKHDRQDSGK